jgi:hypothetical protein
MWTKWGMIGWRGLGRAVGELGMGDGDVMKCNEADEVLDFLFIMRIDFVLADDVEISVLSLCGLRLFSRVFTFFPI